VNDRGWKARYVFVQTSSVVGTEAWVVPEWNPNGKNNSFATVVFNLSVLLC